MSNQSKSLRVAAKFAAATLGLATVFGAATAHVLPGSPLMQYKGFINKMSKVGDTYTGGCCHLQDAIGNVPEHRTTDAQGNAHYTVTLNTDSEGHPLLHPINVPVPDDAILTGRWAVQFCDALKAQAPDDPDSKTCNPPPMNIVWTSAFDVDEAERIYKGEEPATDIYVWCYWPKPQIM